MRGKGLLSLSIDDSTSSLNRNYRLMGSKRDVQTARVTYRSEQDPTQSLIPLIFFVPEIVVS